MKKIFLSASLIAFLTSMTYCNSNSQKEIAPESQPTELSQESAIETAANEEVASDDESGWAGTYIHESGMTLKVSKPAADGAIQFELAQTGENCQGEFKETAHMISPVEADFYSTTDMCHLKLRQAGEGVILVSDSDCESYRGENCNSYDGRYHKN